MTIRYITQTLEHRYKHGMGRNTSAMVVCRPHDGQHDREEDDDDDAVDDVEGVPLIGRLEGASTSTPTSPSSGSGRSTWGSGEGGCREDRSSAGGAACGSLVRSGEPQPTPTPRVVVGRGGPVPKPPLPPPLPPHRQPPPRARRTYVAAVALTAAFAVFVLLAGDTGVARGPLALGGSRRRGPPSSDSDDDKDPRRILERMRTRFAAAKARLQGRIEGEYGVDIARGMFLLPNSNSTTHDTQATRGRLLFTGADGTNDTSGWDGLKRKLTVKLLRALNGGPGGGDTSDRSDRSDPRVPVTWVTSGNSIAAGHGNLLHESYTAVLERAVAPLFEALSLRFVGRNYGVSAAMSGANTALCMEAKLGTDVDLLLWDYSHTGTLSVAPFWLRWWRWLRRGPPTLLGRFSPSVCRPPSPPLCRDVASQTPNCTSSSSCSTAARPSSGQGRWRSSGPRFPSSRP
jgi:hypothetical protein